MRFCETLEVGSMSGQIEATGRNVTGNVGQKWPNFGNFVWTKMGGFGKIWDLTFIGTIPGPMVPCRQSSTLNALIFITPGAYSSLFTTGIPPTRRRRSFPPHSFLSIK